MKLVRWTSCPVCGLAAEIVDEWFVADPLTGEPQGMYRISCPLEHGVTARSDLIVEDGETV